jgi:hypothetical protein
MVDSGSLGAEINQGFRNHRRNVCGTVAGVLRNADLDFSLVEQAFWG